MKIKLKDIKPNPFKKQIDDGKLNKEQVKRLKSSIKELGLMGSIPVVKIKNKYHLVSHHHRHQAIKELYGVNKDVEVTVQKYSQDQLIRGMVIENLTQRSDDFKEIVQNLKCVRGYLKKRSDTERISKSKTKPFEAGSIRHIAEWLNKQGEVMGIGSISEHLQVADNLSSELYRKVEKTHSGDAGKRTDGKTISKSQAIMLSKFKDKTEQKDLAKALNNSRENRVRNQSQLLTIYKQADKETKKLVRKGDIDIEQVSCPVIKDLTKIDNRKKSAFEINVEFVQKCTALINNDIPNLKKCLSKLPPMELETLYYFLIHWCKEDIAPLIKAIIREIAKRQANGKGKNKKDKKRSFSFEIISEDK